jgi:hypothetical protein
VNLGNPFGHAFIAMYLLAIDPEQNFYSAETELGHACGSGDVAFVELVVDPPSD